MENRPLYSAEITDIIGTPPRWIVRAGGGLLLALLLGAVAVAGGLRLPKHHGYLVRLRGAVAPYYLRQTAGRLQPAVATGRVARQGRCLARAGRADRADTAGAVRAPFAGTFFAAGLAEAAIQPGDTLGLLVPLANTFRFSGRMALEQLAGLRQAGTLTIEVPLAGHADRPLVLHGQLSYLDPTVRGGLATYQGHLDSASNVALARQLPAITQLTGTLLISSTPQTVLHRLLRAN